MRIVVALGGNALLRRGQALSAENQRANVRTAAEALAPVAHAHQLVISHGNGPQVGLLALQSAAYSEVDPYPLDVLGAQTEGMIGYMIEQELGNLLPFERPFATLLTMIEVDPADPKAAAKIIYNKHYASFNTGNKRFTTVSTWMNRSGLERDPAAGHRRPGHSAHRGVALEHGCPRRWPGAARGVRRRAGGDRLPPARHRGGLARRGAARRERFVRP